MPASSRSARPAPPDPRTDCRASSASSASVKPWTCAGDLVLGGQPGAEEQRVVGAERHRHPGVEQRAQRDVLGLLVDAERHVGRRADLAGHPPVGEPAAAAAGPRPPARRGRSAPACRSSRQSRTLARAGQLAAVRGGEQAALAGDGEGAVEVAGQAAALVVGEPEADDARGPRTARRAGPACGRPAGASSGWRRPGPACRRPVSRDARVHRVQDDLQGRDQPAEPRGVRGRVDLDLQPARSRPRRPPRRPRAPAAGCPRGRAGRSGRCRRAAGSGTSRARRWPAASAARRAGQRLGQADAVLVGQFQQGAWAASTR